MFREDTLVVKREKYTRENGATIYMEPEILYENIPCHLSVNLNNTSSERNIPYLYSEYTLFLNYASNININENDILLISTNKGQEYKLYAGDIKIYSHSIQIKCRQEKIIESDD